jgi:hypothetical protein
MTERKYGREDVDYETFYSSWMRQLASNHHKNELEIMLYGAKAAAETSTRTHLNAIQKSSSMTGRSMARAHARNCASLSGDRGIAISGAIEIHELFPEHARLSTSN